MSLQSVSLKQATDFALKAIKANLVPFITSSPGAGKSASIRQIAAQLNLKVIDVRLAQEDPTVLSGFPSVEGGRSDFVPPKRFPIESDVLPLLPNNYHLVNDYRSVLSSGDADNIKLFQDKYCYSGWLLFFDEINAAPQSVMSAAYKIVLEREVGNNKLHSKVHLVCAGNLSTDNAIVHEMGTAMRSRVCHIKVHTNGKDYIDLITKKLNFDSRVISYLAYQIQNVNNFDKYNSGSSDETFACERTWNFVSDYLKANYPNQGEAIPSAESTMLCGMVGSIAMEFVTFTQAFDQLPTYEEITTNPQEALLPTKPSVCWLAVGMLMDKAELTNVATLLEYVQRMSKEFVLVFLKMLWGKDDAFLDVPEVEKLFCEIGDLLA